MWKRHPKLLRVWQDLIAWSITITGEIVWWSMDERHWRKRKIDWEIQIPRRVFRPYCWVYGHDRFGDYRCTYCVICDKVLDKH